MSSSGNASSGETGGEATQSLPPLAVSRTAIEDLVHRYAYHIRHGQAAACAELFTPDIVFEVDEMDPRAPDRLERRAHVVGLEAVLAYIAGDRGTQLCVVPLIHNLLIDVGGSVAEASCMMESRSFPAGFEVVGEYRDRFRFLGGQWRIAARHFTMYRSKPDV
jgi:hypothetical protein